MKRSNFGGTEKCYSYYLSVLVQLGLKQVATASSTTVAHGGTVAINLSRPAFEVLSFEGGKAVGTTPGEARRFGLLMTWISPRLIIPNQFDCFFSAHVLEHRSFTIEGIQLRNRLLKRDGLFVSFTPNGSESHRATSTKLEQKLGRSSSQFNR